MKLLSFTKRGKTTASRLFGRGQMIVNRHDEIDFRCNARKEHKRQKTTSESQIPELKVWLMLLKLQTANFLIRDSWNKEDQSQPSICILRWIDRVTCTMHVAISDFGSEFINCIIETRTERIWASPSAWYPDFNYSEQCMTDGLRRVLQTSECVIAPVLDPTAAGWKTMWHLLDIFNWTPKNINMKSMLKAVIDHTSEQVQTFFLIAENYQSCSESRSTNPPAMPARCESRRALGRS
jgi:hypothetical protein